MIFSKQELVYKTPAKSQTEDAMPFTTTITLPTDLRARMANAKNLFCLELFLKNPVDFECDVKAGTLTLTMTRRDVEQIMKEQQKLLADINYSDLPHIPQDLLCTVQQIYDGNTIFVWITDNGTAAMTLEVLGLRLTPQPNGVQWQPLLTPRNDEQVLRDVPKLRQEIMRRMKDCPNEPVVTRGDMTIFMKLDVMEVHGRNLFATSNSHFLQVKLCTLTLISKSKHSNFYALIVQKYTPRPRNA